MSENKFPPNTASSAYTASATPAGSNRPSRRPPNFSAWRPSRSTPNPAAIASTKTTAARKRADTCSEPYTGNCPMSVHKSIGESAPSITRPAIAPAAYNGQRKRNDAAIPTAAIARASQVM